VPQSKIQTDILRPLASLRDPERAEAFVTRMPTDKVGLLFLRDGHPVQPNPDSLEDYQTHAGQRRGQWPSSADIAAAMFERYKMPPSS
jgi:hypothetical protein